MDQKLNFLEGCASILFQLNFYQNLFKCFLTRKKPKNPQYAKKIISVPGVEVVVGCDRDTASNLAEPIIRAGYSFKRLLYTNTHSKAPIYKRG